MKKLTFLFLLTVITFVGNAWNLYQHGPASEKLVLNKGAKWKLDKTTLNNVLDLQRIAKAGEGKTTKTLTDYHQTASTLQTGITKMIRECRLKGPDHMALHKWLEPLMEHVAGLNRATKVASARKLFNAIHDRLNMFHQYFQV